ncbi:MEKHLA domain-containing protein [Sphingomonas sp. ASY06-1R]|uniref:MEKHLA domain-containing protein n=1 Tax=Sphingomonas sp. ASY06-1R TaxID=3445771 RepID=UPI003FA24CB7
MWRTARGENPIFFGNAVRLQAFEMSAAQFTDMPFRFSVKPRQRQERRRLLDYVTRTGSGPIMPALAFGAAAGSGSRTHRVEPCRPS